MIIISTIETENAVKKNRFYYLDNLKILLTFLVIAHHSSQAYGPTGGQWVYHNSGGNADGLGNFMAVNASFFMGLFFMISGYFIPQSYKGKKTGEFIAQKFKRLMLPVLFILIVIVPVYFYLADNFNSENHLGFIDYYINIYWGTGIFSYEHGWYIVNLLMYSLVYAVVMIFLKTKEIKLFRNFKTSYILLLAALVVILSFFVRMIFPIDTWIDLFGFIGMEPAHVTQYVLFFIFGILAYKNKYFEKIPKKTGFITLSAGLFMALIIYLSDFSFMSKIIPFIWKSWAFYESFMAVFISIGLIVAFREYFNKSNAFLKALAHNAFGAYIVHNLFVVSFQLFFDDVYIGASLKFISVSALSIISSFMISYFFSKLTFLIVTRGKLK